MRAGGSRMPVVAARVTTGIAVLIWWGLAGPASAALSGADDPAVPGAAPVLDVLSSDPERAAPSAGPEAADAGQSTRSLQVEAERFKQEAIAVAGRLRADLANHLDALALAAGIHDQYGDTDEALVCWQQAMKLNPSQAEVHSAIGYIALRKGQSEEAAAAFRRALELTPKLPGAHHRLAHALMAMGQMREAVTALEAAAQITPDASRIWYMLGQAHVHLGEFDDARACYEKAVSINADEIDAYYGLATACARLGQPDQAKVHRQEFQRRKAEYWKAYKDMRSLYDDADTMRRTLAQTCAAAGTMYARHGQVGNAEPLWRRAAELDLKDTRCRQQLAVLYQSTGRLNQAVGVCQELARIEPDDPGHRLNLGSLYARLRQPEAARAVFQQARPLAEKATQQAPTASNYFTLSLACDRTGDRKGALAAIRRAVQLAPDNAQYQQLLRMLETSSP